MQPVYIVQNLLPGNCRPGVQPVYKVSGPTSREYLSGVKHVYTVSEPISRGLFARDTSCLNGFLAYLQGTVRWG